MRSVNTPTFPVVFSFWLVLVKGKLKKSKLFKHIALFLTSIPGFAYAFPYFLLTIGILIGNQANYIAKASIKSGFLGFLFSPDVFIFIGLIALGNMCRLSILGCSTATSALLLGILIKFAVTVVLGIQELSWLDSPWLVSFLITIALYLARKFGVY